MILKSVHVENWSCIGRLHLDGLSEGIVVLYGPNRTGKTSLVRALRGSLFDFEFDTGKRDLKKNLPWNGTGDTKVAVEFFAGGADFRFTKVYGRKGIAILEKKVGQDWRKEDLASKEAGKKVQELLGAEESNAGLYQLLWLEQGEVCLPAPGSLDSNLQRQLIQVLGVMVTGRDLQFKEELDRRCDKWFTAKGDSYKKGSTVMQWKAEVEKRQTAWEQANKKFAEIQDTFSQLEQCQDSRQEQLKSVQEATQEAARLKQERDQCQQRVELFRKAEVSCQLAKGEVEKAARDLRLFQEARERSQAFAKVVSEISAEVQQAQELKERLFCEHAQTLSRLQEACHAEEACSGTREEIEDRRKLLSLAQRRDQLEPKLIQVQELEKDIADLQARVEQTLAPDLKALTVLREQHRKAEQLQAQLLASRYKLSVQLQRSAEIKISLDGGEENSIELPAAKRGDWTFLQGATLDVADVGRIELARVQENVDLIRTARELADLSRNFEDTVRSFQEDPKQEGCVDRLAERKIHKENWIAKLKESREVLLSQAPNGGVALQKDLQFLENQRKVILERRPDLAGWQPVARDVEERDRAFQQQRQEFGRIRKNLETKRDQAQTCLQQAENLWQNCKERLAGAVASEKTSREEFQRLGEEGALQACLEQCQKAFSEAQLQLTQCRLTAAEQSIEHRCADAENSLHQRQQRLRELEDQINNLSGFLRGNEGMHLLQADAEAALAEAQKVLQRETLEAEAHRRLRDLFESCRQSRVEMVMGPVSKRVMEWAHTLGLKDCQDMRFGDKFLPETIELQGGRGITLEEESYGTGEQLSLLVRLALGGLLARHEPMTAILDDPLVHADSWKHRRILDVFRLAAAGNSTWTPPAGPLQIIILTCHPERFDHLPGAQHIDLAKLITRVS